MAVIKLTKKQLAVLKYIEDFEKKRAIRHLIVKLWQG